MFLRKFQSRTICYFHEKRRKSWWKEPYTLDKAVRVYVVSAGVVPVACAGKKQWLSMLQKYVGCRHIETLFIFVIKLFIFYLEPWHFVGTRSLNTFFIFKKKIIIFPMRAPPPLSPYISQSTYVELWYLVCSRPVGLFFEYIKKNFQIHYLIIIIKL